MIANDDEVDPMASLGAWLERNGLDKQFDESQDKQLELIERWCRETD